MTTTKILIKIPLRAEEKKTFEKFHKFSDTSSARKAKIQPRKERIKFTIGLKFRRNKQQREMEALI